MSFNYANFDPSKYGLTKTDKGGSPEDGVISDGKGNYYKIDGFERQQKEDLDTDVLGKSAGLEGLAKEHTDFSVTTFNTSSDVQKALQKLAGSNDKPAEAAPSTRMSWNEAVEGGHLGQNIMDAIERTENYKKAKHSNKPFELFNVELNLDDSSSTEMTDEAKAQMTNKISNQVSSTMREKV